jgi:glycosyltransferase involved in cell wall biosynthesis
MRKAKFVLNTMVANEIHCIERMLASVAPYIDYWVIQDNGSTDGTQEAIKEFFKKANIPGELYETEWSGIPGKNRDHALQKCLATNHGCDWILRVDADEAIEVDSGFDWSVFDDKSVQSFNVFAKQFNTSYFRTWIWNANLPWKFKHDKRHECIYIDSIGEGFQRMALDTKYHHVVYADGQTWNNPYKWIVDALELERDMIMKGQLGTDRYHLMYLAKSYRDYCTYWASKYPLGDCYKLECSRRGNYFFKKYMEICFNYPAVKKPDHFDESGYCCLIFMSELHASVGQTEEALQCLLDAESFCPERNEHLMHLARIYEGMSDKANFLAVTTRMASVDRKNPFPRYAMFIDNDCYSNTSDMPFKMHHRACLWTNADLTS